MTTFCTMIGTIFCTGITIMLGAYCVYVLTEKINGMKK